MLFSGPPRDLVVGIADPLYGIEACLSQCKAAPLRFTLLQSDDWMLRLLPAEVPSPAVLRLAPDTAAKIHLPILCQQLNTTVTALSTAAPAFCLRVNGVRIA